MARLTQTADGSYIGLDHIVSIYCDVLENGRGFLGRVIAKTTDGDIHVIYLSSTMKSVELAQETARMALEANVRKWS